MSVTQELKFIADNNVGKLARWLRMMGYDTLLFNGNDDSEMVAIAVKENRIILTRDTEITKRRLVTSGRLKVILLNSDRPPEQVQQVVDSLKLDSHFRSFTRCLECNQPLVRKTKEEVKEQVPPHVYRTQDEFMQCPVCRRIYWKGTHWQAMKRKLETLSKD